MKNSEVVIYVGQGRGDPGTVPFVQQGIQAGNTYYTPTDIPALWDFDGLPGKRGFDLAHAALKSKVEAVFCDLMKIDVQLLGQFDVVLYLGVLYHTENPLESLKLVRAVTSEVAIIETEAVAIGGYDDRPLCEFFVPKSKLMGNPNELLGAERPRVDRTLRDGRV